MKINIGDNLKQLRLQKGLTQEQLADVLGVSAQAVSRWENNTSYPDITLLPGLAIYFNTSVDAIVGMDEIRKEETLRKIHGEINDLVISGQTDKAVALIRDSLKIYPNDSGLLMSLGETLAHQKDDPAATQEAITIAERILQSNDVSTKAKGTTSANLLFLYLRAGQQEKAESLIRSIPHIWESGRSSCQRFMMVRNIPRSSRSASSRFCPSSVRKLMPQPKDRLVLLLHISSWAWTSLPRQEQHRCSPKSKHF